MDPRLQQPVRLCRFHCMKRSLRIGTAVMKIPGLLIDIDANSFQLLPDQCQLFHRAVHGDVPVKKQDPLIGQNLPGDLADGPAITFRGQFLQSFKL